MKVINTGNRYEIYQDDLQTFDELPAQFYTVRFNKMSGFSLQKYSGLEIKEDKIYGVHMSKVNKVLNAFPTFERNLGVILSGPKGIGKSLFAKKLSIEANKLGYPVIIVRDYIPGIADFIESIEQEVVVLFDEFDKTFAGKKDGQDPQSEMLTLFDGVSYGKKMFIITCNNVRGLNDYFVNRPGRCHYHLRFGYPTPEEITEYMQDKIDEKYYEEINNVIQFSRKVDLNYDCLRAIAYELNNGESFKEVIKDLNIVNTEKYKYTATLVMADGSIDTNTFTDDLFDKNNVIVNGFYINNVYISTKFNVSDCKFDDKNFIYYVDGRDIRISYDDEDLEEYKGSGKEFPKPKYMKIERKYDKGIHYTV